MKTKPQRARRSKAEVPARQKLPPSDRLEGAPQSSVEGDRADADRRLTMLCVATYEKGGEFLKECKRLGCRVLLLTVDTLAQGKWPWDAIDDTFYIPRDLGRDQLVKAVSYVARTQRIDRIVALDDFDVQTAAQLREHLRIPGMGDTTARYFRDKLAMRVKARDHNVRVPPFVHVLNHDAIREYSTRVSPPWLIKPRSQASAIGIRKIENVDQLWQVIHSLGDDQPLYVLEQYIPGDIYHVDSIVSERRVVFSAAHKYGQPPMDVAHQGGVFTTRTLPRESTDAKGLEAINRDVLVTLGLVRGVTHTEFIKAHEDGQFYFLETSARVGGAYIVDLIEAATSVNLWREWARIEVAGEEGRYSVSKARSGYAGIVLSLARQEHPDTSAYNDPEIVTRIQKHHHAGLLVASDSPARIDELLDDYQRRFYEDFFATEPLPDRPWS